MKSARSILRQPYRPTPLPPPVTLPPPEALSAHLALLSHEGDNDDDDSEIGFEHVPAGGRRYAPVAFFAAIILLGLASLGLVLVPRLYIGSYGPLAGSASLGRTQDGTASTASATIQSGAQRPPKPTEVKVLTAKAWSLWQTSPRTFDLLAPPLEPFHVFHAMRSFPPGFDIIEAGLMQADTTTIRLSWLASLPANTICLSEQSTKFACGLMARASLSLLTKGENLNCYPDVALDTETPSYLCSSHGRDVAMAQIEAGFALPNTQSVPKLAALAADAHARHIGAWRGDWTIVLPTYGGPPVNQGLGQ